jgi:MFS family permease
MTERGRVDVHGALRLTTVAAFLCHTSSALFLLLPVYLQQAGNSPAQIGLVAGLLRISSLIARPVVGRLLDRFGRRPVLAAGAAIGIAAILSLYLFPHFGAVFLIMRALQGAAMACIDSGLSAVVADLSPPAARAQIFALYTVFITLPGGVMPGIGELLARQAGFFPLFGLAALALAAGLALVRRLPETARHDAAAGGSLSGVLAEAAPAMLGTILVGVAFGVLTVFVPVAEIAAAPGRIGLFFFAYFAGLISIRLSGGLGLAGVSKPAALLPAYGIMAAGLTALPLGGTAALLTAVGLGCGAGHGIAIPILYSLLLSAVPRNRRGMGVSLLAAAFDLGVVIGTMGLGLAAEWLGTRGIFFVAAGIVATGAAAGAVWQRATR